MLKLAVLALLLIVANVAAEWVAEALEMELRPSTEPAVHRMIMAAAALYAVLMAMPFVPGVEVGLALMAMLGPPI